MLRYRLGTVNDFHWGLNQIKAIPNLHMYCYIPQAQL